MLIESLEHRPRPWYPMVVESDDDWLHEHGFRREGNRPVRVSPGEAAAARKADDP